MVKNNQGYALITVLLTFVFISTLTVSLMGFAINSRKQIELAEEDNQAIDLAEMGVVHVETAIKSIISENETEETILQNLQALKNTFSENNMVDDQHYYSVNFDSQLPNLNDEKNEITYQFTSTGVANHFSHTIRGTILLTGTSKTPDATVKRFPNKKEDIAKPYQAKRGLNLFNNETQDFNDSLLVSGNVTSSNNSQLNVANDLFIIGDLNVGNSGIIKNGGHFFVQNNINLSNNAELQTTKNLAIKGNVNLGNDTIVSGHHAFFDNNTILGNGSKLLLNGAFFIDGELNLHNNSSTKTNGDMTITRNTNVENNAAIRSQGNMTNNGSLTIKQNGSVILAGNLNVMNNIILENNSIIHSQGNMTSKGSLTIKENGSVFIEGNLYANNVTIENNGKLEIHGDAYFDKKMDKKNNAKICVAGTTYLKQNNAWQTYNVSNYFCKKSENNHSPPNQTTKWKLDLNVEYYQEEKQ